MFCHFLLYLWGTNNIYMPGLTQLTDAPRWEVIAEWPGGLAKGDLLKHDSDLLSILLPDKYPHLFRRMEWYERRELHEMPLYVKSSFYTVIPVKFWKKEGELFYCCLPEGTFEPASLFTPATAEEYNDQFNHIGTL